MFNFLKYRALYFAISAVVIGVGLISIFTGGFKYSVEFTGGSNLEYKINKKTSLEQIKAIYQKERVEVISVKLKDSVLNIRTKPMDEKKEAAIKKRLERDLKITLTTQRSETVGPILGRELVRKTIIATIIGIIGILIYVSFAFKSVNFALAAIGALIHDILVMVGIYSLLGRFYGAEIDTLFVTAALTTMSFSVHDTIVIFDKIREYKREATGNIEYFANRALTQTMVRSLNNSMTIVFMLLALTLLGGATIKFFVIALLIGTVTGTYSSPFIATPLLLILEKRK